jgi:hypothetical protein
LNNTFDFLNIGGTFTKFGSVNKSLHCIGNSLFLGATGAATPIAPYLNSPSIVDGTLTYNTVSGQV